jgi:acetyl esterase/lipase
MHWKNNSYICIFFILILVSSFLSGCTNPPDADYQLFDDIVYQEIPDVDVNLVSLDIYVPSFNQSFLKYSLFHNENNKSALPCISEIKNSLLSNDRKPVMIWVHGGGWRSGDKTNQMDYKIPYFINENWIFVSVNYRLSPYDIPDLPEDLNPNRIKYPVHSQDVAAAVAWVHNNIEKYGGNPNQISLMGHSAGANIVSTIGTNETFLKEHGLNLSVLQHIISLDTAAYDIREI